jgi:hypothetical protein
MRYSLTLALALVAAALGAATASADTTIVRPSATALINAPWSVSPIGGDAAAVLADAVTAPAVPSTTGDLLSAGTGSGAYVGVTLPAPSLPAGATPTAVTAWIYAGVGSTQNLTPSLWTGSTLLGWTSYTAGPAAWHSFTLSPTPSAAQLTQLTLVLRTDGNAGVPPTKVYAAYLAVDTPAAPGGAPAAGGAVGVETPDAAATSDTPDAETGQPATAGLGRALTDDAPLAELAPPIVIAAPPIIDLPVQAKALPVSLSCPADADGACRGTVQIQLLGAPPARRAHARAARCARGCRVIGESSFTIAAGRRKPVKVRLRPTALKLIPRGHSARVKITVTSRDRGHRASTTSQTVTVRRGA